MKLYIEFFLLLLVSAKTDYCGKELEYNNFKKCRLIQICSLTLQIESHRRITNTNKILQPQIWL